MCFKKLSMIFDRNSRTSTKGISRNPQKAGVVTAPSVTSSKVSRTFRICLELVQDGDGHRGTGAIPVFWTVREVSPFASPAQEAYLPDTSLSCGAPRVLESPHGALGRARAPDVSRSRIELGGPASRSNGPNCLYLHNISTQHRHWLPWAF